MTPPFTLRLERQGGFAGIPLRAVVSSDELEGDEAARLWALVDRDALASATSAPAAGLPRPDALSYRLVVETPEGRSEYRFGQDAVGPQLQPLVERLEQQLSF